MELRGQRTHYRLSKEVGIDITQLRRYELGRIPTDDLLKKLAVFYQVPFAELKALSFEDLYPPTSEARTILCDWVESIKHKA